MPRIPSPIALAVGLWSLLVATDAAAQSSCLFDRVDDFENDVIDANTWRVFTRGTGSVSEVGGRLELELPTSDAAAGLILACRWEGDLDATVRYEILDAPEPNDLRIALAIVGEHRAAIQRVIGPSCPGCQSYVADLDGAETAVPTTLSSGILRLIRRGAVVTTMTWDGAGWLELASATLDSTPPILRIEARTGSTPGAHGRIALDDFHAGTARVDDDFEDGVLDTGRWTRLSSPESTIQEIAGHLEIAIAGVDQSAGLEARRQLRGDFDARVDFALVGDPGAGGFRVELALQAGIEIVASVEHATDISCAGCREWRTLLGDRVTSLPTTETAGSLRLVRRGDEVSGYFGSDSAWTAIDSRSISGMPRDVSLRIRTIVPPAGMNGSAAFDHIRVSEPEDAGDPAVEGRWDVLAADSQVLAVQAAVLRTGKVLYIAGSANDSANTLFEARLWNPVTEQTTPFVLENDLFCSGMSFLPDGKLMLSGGTLRYGPFTGLRDTTEFDPIAERFEIEEKAPLAHGRFYPTSLALPDGRVLLMSGSDDVTGDLNPDIEVYSDETDRWQTVSRVPDDLELTLYPWLHLLKDGRVLHTGRSTDTAALDVGSGTWTRFGSSRFGLRDYGNSVLLPLNPPTYDQRVMIVGGTDYCFRGVATASAEILDVDQANPSWRWVEPMCCPRVDHMSVILPDCSILTLGGSPVKEARRLAVLRPEIFNPATEKWTKLAKATVPRVYHSVAALLPDGRVWVSGSSPIGRDNELRVEIFSPPYLFKGARPRILSAPNVVEYGESFSIVVEGGPLARVRLMRPTACTHANEFEQRCVGAQVLSGAEGNGTVTLLAPPNANIAPPGYYMLIVLDDRIVPSEAAWVRLVASRNAPEFATRRGNVNLGASSEPAAVLSVAGQTGDPISRVVRVAPGPVTVSIDRPPSGGEGRYAIWILDGEPDAQTVTEARLRTPRGSQSLGMAARCLPLNNSVAPGSCPCEGTFPTGFTSQVVGRHAAENLCLEPRAPLGQAPTSFVVTMPAGTYTVLGATSDPGSHGRPRHVSLTNAVVVEVVPQ